MVHSVYELTRALSAKRRVTIWTTDFNLEFMDRTIRDVCDVRVFRAIRGSFLGTGDDDFGSVGLAAV